MAAIRLPAQTKAALIAIHRYTGAALCLLFAIWFISGVAMAYRREPPLTDEQRLAFSQSLDSTLAAMAPDQVSTLAESWHDAKTLRLGQFQGRPLYRWMTNEAGWQAAWADTGTSASFDAQSLEPEAARWFGAVARFRYDGSFNEHGQWSYFSTVWEHYPLHRFSTEGLAPHQVFFSSRTGEPVVATSLGIRLLYYLGPGLHYFSLYPIRNNDPLWRGLVNWTSGVGALSCLVGIIIGLWQLRWRAIGTGRRVVPYGRRWMRWHHWAGLLFGVVTFTFVLSGLFSMNPAAIFPSTDIPTTLESAFLGPRPPLSALPSPASLDGLLRDAVKELEWRRLRGQPYIVARRDPATERLLWPRENGFVQRPPFTNAELVKSIGDLLPAPIHSVERVTAFDDYYYTRHGRYLPLPVVRMRLQDEQSTWYYLDPDTGQLFLKSNDGTRLRRWLYNGLHSLDMQSVLGQGWWRDIIIWLLSLGGLALSVTGVVITWHWIQRSITSAMADSLVGNPSTGTGTRLGPMSQLKKRNVD